MSHDDMSLAMFWVGAMMVFTPLIAAGIVIGFWWRGRKHEKRQ